MAPRIGIGAIFKNEGPYVLEWVAYHRAIGVERFFIADNNSDDGTSELLAALQAIGLVNHIPFPHLPGEPPQLPAYAEIMRRHKRDADWVAFIDADEFLVPADENSSLPGLFAAFDSGVGAVAANWAIYGSSFRREPWKGPVVERFVRRAEIGFQENYHYKTIVRSAAYHSPRGNPHQFRIGRGYRLVHADGQPVADHPVRGGGLSETIRWEPLRINHYAVKSLAEFDNKKTPRGSATVLTRVKGESYFRHHDRNDVEDPVAPWLVRGMRREMKRIRALLRQAGSEKRLVNLDKAVAGLKPITKIGSVPAGFGSIDDVRTDGNVVVLAGWAIGRDHAPVKQFSVRSGKGPAVKVRTERLQRPDIARQFPGAGLDCGFRLKFPLAGLSGPEVGEPVVRVGDSEERFPLYLRPAFQEVLRGAAARAGTPEGDDAVASQPEPRRIFVIGLNKCGTTSIHALLKRSGVPSLHYQYSDNGEVKNLGRKMFNNMISGRKAIAGLEDTVAFSDMSYVDGRVFVDCSRLFENIFRDYPDAYYVLNVRNVDRWIRSRFRHDNGSLAKRACSVYECGPTELDAIWRYQFARHEAEVREFFARSGGMLLRFDIEEDKPKKLADFLAQDYKIDIRHWSHEHRTS